MFELTGKEKKRGNVMLEFTIHDQIIYKVVLEGIGKERMKD
jgi:hypothetical protein